MTQRIGRRNVAKKVAALGQTGTTTYRQGEVTFHHAAGTLVVRPAFGIDHDAAYDHVETAPLLEALDRDYRVGALLVRLGGYAVGVFEGDRLVVSKVGQRLVHGRDKAGGSSANRPPPPEWSRPGCCTSQPPGRPSASSCHTSPASTP